MRMFNVCFLAAMCCLTGCTWFTDEQRQAIHQGAADSVSKGLTAAKPAIDNAVKAKLQDIKEKYADSEPVTQE